VPIVLTINTPVSGLRFFEISGMAIGSANEKFTSERHLMHFFVVTRQRKCGKFVL
jgi:hypothetical protein